MSKFKYEDLTEAEQAQITDGCGAGWFHENWRKYFFDWFFYASCNRHDFNYMVGGNEWDRFISDLKFLGRMIVDSFRDVRFVLIRFPIAFLFYFAVRIGGWYPFRYGKKANNRDELFQYLRERRLKRLAKEAKNKKA